MLTLHSFRHKIFFGKYIFVFLIFDATENNSQIKNILYLTKKDFFVSKMVFVFKI